MRVRVPADMATGFEHRNVVLAAEMVGHDIASDTGADNGDFHAAPTSRRASRLSSGTERRSQIRPSAANSLRQ